MKKTTYHYAAACLAALIFLTLSCQDKREKEVFEKPAIERLQQNSRALCEKLKASPQGWIISYKPNWRTGYYQFLFRFVNDTEVEMASDFSSADLDWKTSEYSILIGSTTKLSFSTTAPIHKLSDSGFSPLPNAEGVGLRGDFEFLYYGEDAQGNLVFRTNRTNRTILFKKADENSPDDLKTSYDNFENLSKSKSIFRWLSELKDGQISRQWKYSFAYNARVIKISEPKMDYEGKPWFDDGAGYTTGFWLTSEGVFLDSVRRKNGEILKNVQFKYNEEEYRYETTLSDGTLLAFGDSDRAIMQDAYLRIFLNPSLTERFDFFYRDVWTKDFTTGAFVAIVEKLAPIFGIPVDAPFEKRPPILAPDETWWRWKIPAKLSANFLIFSLYVQSNEYNKTKKQNKSNDKMDYIVIQGTGGIGVDGVGGPIRERLGYEDKGDRVLITRKGFVDEESRVKPEYEALYDEFMKVLTDSYGLQVYDWRAPEREKGDIFTLSSRRDENLGPGVVRNEAEYIQIGCYRVKPNH